MRRVSAADGDACGWEGDLPPDAFHRWSMAVDLGDGQALRCEANVAVGTHGSGSGWIAIPIQGVLDRLHDVEIAEDVLRFTYRAAAAATTWAHFEVRVQDDGTASGAMQQNGSSMALRAVEGRELPRPQDPVPPLPYDEVEVRIATADPAVRLAGTLTIPRGEGPHPAALLLTGSGT